MGYIIKKKNLKKTCIILSYSQEKFRQSITKPLATNRYLFVYLFIYLLLLLFT